MKRTNPMTQALLTGAILIVVGMLAITLGKRVVARTEDVYDQMPALVSGGVGGIALVIIGCVLAYVQVGRVLAQQERLVQADIIDDVVALTELKRAKLEAAAPQEIPTEPVAEAVVEPPARRPRRTRTTPGTTKTATGARRTTRVRSDA